MSHLPSGAWECPICQCYNLERYLICIRCGYSKSDEIHTRFDPCEEEAELHSQIEAYLRGKGWPYFHSRMDRPHTDKLGTPDFIIAMPEGITIYVECKSKKGKAAVEQLATMVALKKFGHKYYLVRSITEFISVL